MIENEEKFKSLVGELQNRNVEITKGIVNQTQIQERLAKTEDNLRKETALSEEQRAQIKILK